MRAFLIAMLFAIGIALAGTSGVTAAPVSGGTIRDAATVGDMVEQAQHWRWGSGGGGWDGDFHSPRRSHWRRGSGGGGYVCPTVCRHRGWTSERICVQRC